MEVLRPRDLHGASADRSYSYDLVLEASLDGVLERVRNVCTTAQGLLLAPLSHGLENSFLGLAECRVDFSPSGRGQERLVEFVSVADA